MRLKRCRLRHGRVRWLLVLLFFCVSVTIISVITQNFSFLSKTKNTQMNCFHVNISCICHPLFARLRYNLILFIDWFYCPNKIYFGSKSFSWLYFLFVIFLFFCKIVKLDIKQEKNYSSWTATSEAQTHDLKIMRLTRCRLRHGRLRCLLVLRHFFVSVTIISVITQKFCFLSKTKNTQMNCFHVNISCICHPLFARLRYNLIFFIDWFY